MRGRRLEDRLSWKGRQVREPRSQAGQPSKRLAIQDELSDRTSPPLLRRRPGRSSVVAAAVMPRPADLPPPLPAPIVESEVDELERAWCESRRRCDAVCAVWTCG